jgi:hypothetical protein
MKRILYAAFGIWLALTVPLVAGVSYGPVTPSTLGLGPTNYPVFAGLGTGLLYTPAVTCDALTYTADGGITSGLNVFTTSAATFTAADVGKKIAVANVGANQFLASAAVSAAGTGYIPFSTITLSPGSGTASTNAVARITSTQVVSATVAAGGSGGTTGTQTVTGTTGFGTKFTASVTVSGGAITAVLSISAGGKYTVNPSVLTAEPVTGASLAGAQLNVVMGVNAVNVYTPGVYSIVDIGAGDLTQSSTSGSGTGATFTGTFDRYPLTTSISGFTNSTTVTLAANASATTSAADFWTYGTDNSTVIGNAITAAHNAGGGQVSLSALGKPCLINSGLSLSSGVTLAGIPVKNFPGTNATPQQWGANGTWLQSIDFTNPAITIINHGSTVSGVNFVHAQPIPGGSWQPVPYPYDISAASNLSRIEHIVDVAGTNGISVVFNGATGGGTDNIISDVLLGTSMIGVHIDGVNDTMDLNFVQVRNLFYNTTASVSTFLSNNLIGADIWYFDNSHIKKYQCFQCFAGMMFTNDTTLGNTHSMVSGYLDDLQFNLVRAAMVVTDNATVGAEVVNSAAQSLSGLTDPLYNLASDNVTLDFSTFSEATAGGAVMVLGNGVSGTVTMGASRFKSWGSGINALTANAGATIFTSGGTYWGSSSNQVGGAGLVYSTGQAFVPTGGSCSNGATSFMLFAAGQPAICANGFVVLLGANIGGIGAWAGIGASTSNRPNSTDIFSMLANSNAIRSFSFDNVGTGASATACFYLGNNTSALEVSECVNGSGNSGGNGANSFTLNAKAGVWLQGNGNNGLEIGATGAATLFNQPTSGTIAYAVCAAANANGLTGGAVILDSSGTVCGLSNEQFKRNIKKWSPTGPYKTACAEQDALKPIEYEYDLKVRPDPGKHAGLGAWATAYVDERLIARDKKGLPRGIRWDAVETLTLACQQEMSAQMTALRAEIARR